MTALAAAGLTLVFPASPLAGIPGGPELWIILFIVLILFGRRLPGVARSLGQGISSFKKGLNEPVEADDLEPKEEKSKTDATKVESSAKSDA